MNAVSAADSAAATTTLIPDKIDAESETGCGKGSPSSAAGRLAIGSPTIPLDLPPAPEPLSAHNGFLDPTVTPTFDPDAFLASRTSGHSLADISSELARHSQSLSDDLSFVINENYRDFVGLGSNLKSEAHRIARLGWITGSSAGPANDPSGSTPTGIAVLGTDEVRTTVMSSRDALRGVEQKVQEVLRRRDEEMERKNHFSLLLELHSSLRRLESLLLISNRSSEGVSHDAMDESDDDDDDNDFYVPGNQTMEDHWQEEERWWSDLESEDVDPPAPASTSIEGPALPNTSPIAVASKQALRRRSSTAHQKIRRRSSARSRFPLLSTHGADPSVSPISSVSLLALPLRVSRSAAEHSSLLFLLTRTLPSHEEAFVPAVLGEFPDNARKQRAAETAFGVRSYLMARSDRIARIRTTLLRDLRTLLAIILRRNTDGSGSLLTSPQAITTLVNVRSASELHDWSEVPPLPENATSEQRHEHALASLREQQSWLEMALSTYTSLGVELDFQYHEIGRPRNQLDGCREAEKTLKDVLVTPWAQATINASALQAVPSISSTNLSVPPTPIVPSENSAGPTKSDGVEYLLAPVDVHESSAATLLRELYNRILSFVAEEAREVCSAAERIAASASSSGLHATIDVFTNVLWDEIATRLMDELGGQIFFVGRTEVFHANYALSMRFLSSLARLAPSPAARDRWEQHRTTVTFRKRWGLNVYFQMRFREVVGRLERGLDTKSVRPSRDSHAPLWCANTDAWVPPLLASTHAALEAFAEPWTPSVHLAPLISRQWRLSLQVLSRLKTDMEAMIEKDLRERSRSGETMSRTASQNNAGHLRNGSGDAVRNSGEGARPSNQSLRPSRTGTPDPSDTALDEHSLDVLTAISVDSTSLSQQIPMIFNTLICPLLFANEESSDTDLRATLEETLSHSLAFTLPLQRTALRTIVSIFKGRCAEPLKLVRSVSTQYRSGVPASGGAANKVGEASYFVAQIFQPLKVYFGIERGNTGRKSAKRLDIVLKTQLVREIVEDIADRYASILLKQNQNFASIQRMKAGASGLMSSLFSSSSAGAKEEEAAVRMRSQMERDVEALRHEIEDFSVVGVQVNVEALVSWKRLKAAASGATEDGTV